MDGKYITGICTVFVAVLMVGGLLMPIIDHTTEGEPVINPDAGWIRMNYDTAASAYTINISASDDGITVSNGTDTQTGDDETIYYADSNLAVWLEDGYFTVLGQSTNGPVFFQSEDDITITRDSEGVSVTDGTNTVSVGVPTWAYVPYSSGSYGFFADGVAASTNNKPTVAVGGGFAGVYAYNDITRYAGLGLELQTVTEGGQITGAYWAKPSAEEPSGEYNPGSITPINPGAITGGDADIQPIDPITIDPEPDVSIMAVPTPNYTDGDWGYNILISAGVQMAIIVSYSGAGGDIVVPATVGGYDVYQVGNGSTYDVIDNTLISANSTLTISDGIKRIERDAFRNASNLTGTLIIPDSVSFIGQNAFYSCGFSKIIIGSGVTLLDDYTFGLSPNLKEVVLSEGLTSIGSSCFQSSPIETINYPASLKTIVGYAFYGNKMNNIILPDTIETVGTNAFAYGSGTHNVGTIVIPESITELTDKAFYIRANDVIIATDAIPTSTSLSIFFAVSGQNVLDLSSTVDYSTERHGLSSSAVFQDNIGDSIGYLGAAFIPGESDLSPSAVALMYVIPALILVSLIIFGAIVFVRRE